MSKEPSKSSNKSEFIPHFKMQFLSPKYWGVWVVLFLMIIFSYMPVKIRNPILGFLGKSAGKLAKSARRRAQINLYYCFPNKTHEEREDIIDEMFSAAPKVIILMVELSCRSPQNFAKKVRWQGLEIIEALQASEQNVIFMVPHGWAVDIPAMLLASQGQKMAAMFHNQRNELVDYLWNYARKKFGGRMHARDDGIKPFISSVRQGYWGYYLPDQDHGIEHSCFSPFFGTYKATLPVVGKLAKLCRAEIVPLFPSYDAKENVLTIKVLSALSNISEKEEQQIADIMNQVIEELVSPNLEQYTWILKLLKTRLPSEEDPYERKDLF